MLSDVLPGRRYEYLIDAAESNAKLTKPAAAASSLISDCGDNCRIIIRTHGAIALLKSTTKHRTERSVLARWLASPRL